jgi:spectinomycin phosphotransferase
VNDEPADLPCALVADLLRRYWGVEADRVEYAPVGFGSYHWIATESSGRRWFVTADHLDAGGGWLGGDAEAFAAALTAAARTTRALAEAGYEFVHAGVPDRDGVLVRRVRPDWMMQLFGYLDGWSTGYGPWEDPAEQRQIAGIVGRLQAATPPDGVRRWELAVPGRALLMSALDDLDRPWTSGPYAEPVRELLQDSGPSIRARFGRFDELAREIEASSDPWVVTHGEPHPGNVIRTSDGRMCLIDWDTVALAPRERDLATVLNGRDDAEPIAAYQRAAGAAPPRPGAVELFDLWWALGEVSGYAEVLRQPHGESTDTAASWRNLQHYARLVQA